MSDLCWSDGGIKQVKAIISNVQSFVDAKISTNKHNLSRSACEQSTNRTEIFELVNNLQDRYSCADITAELHPVKNMIS